MKPMLAQLYSSQDVSGWWMSEKLDGVRAIWAGNRFESRNGNTFAVPSWFTTGLPPIPLDGELYIGRHKFQQTVSTVRKKVPIDKEWNAIYYYVFDAPISGPFETRLAFINTLTANRLIQLPYIICQNQDHLGLVFQQLVSLGAEGVMLRRPQSLYEHRRSSALLKYKAMNSDEAIVVAYQSGEGKYIDKVGALICRWQNKIIKVGTGLSDAERQLPPPIGSQVSFSYQGLTDNKLPRFPVFVAIRNYE